jgi:hypothetical protein
MMLDKQLVFTQKQDTLNLDATETALADAIDLGIAKHLGRGFPMKGYAEGVEASGTGDETMRIRIYAGNNANLLAGTLTNSVVIFDSQVITPGNAATFYRAGPLNQTQAYRYYLATYLADGTTPVFNDVSCGICADVSAPHVE